MENIFFLPPNFWFRILAFSFFLLNCPSCQDLFLSEDQIEENFRKSELELYRIMPFSRSFGDSDIAAGKQYGIDLMRFTYGLKEGSTQEANVITEYQAYKEGSSKKLYALFIIRGAGSNRYYTTPVPIHCGTNVKGALLEDYEKSLERKMAIYASNNLEEKITSVHLQTLNNFFNAEAIRVTPSFTLAKHISDAQFQQWLFFVGKRSNPDVGPNDVKHLEVYKKGSRYYGKGHLFGIDRWHLNEGFLENMEEKYMDLCKRTNEEEKLIQAANYLQRTSYGAAETFQDRYNLPFELFGNNEFVNKEGLTISYDYDKIIIEAVVGVNVRNSSKRLTGKLIHSRQSNGEKEILLSLAPDGGTSISGDLMLYIIDMAGGSIGFSEVIPFDNRRGSGNSFQIYPYTGSTKLTGKEVKDDEVLKRLRISNLNRLRIGKPNGGGFEEYRFISPFILQKMLDELEERIPE